MGPGVEILVEVCPYYFVFVEIQDCHTKPYKELYKELHKERYKEPSRIQHKRVLRGLKRSFAKGLESSL